MFYFQVQQMPPLLGVCLALLSVATPLVWGYSSGCPSTASVCSSMLPGHGAPAKTTPMRYSLTVDGGTSIYTPGLPVTRKFNASIFSTLNGVVYGFSH